MNLKTEKLYETDAYLSGFSARVESSVRERNGHFLTVLNKTAFYPEGGGQPFDIGKLGTVNVLAVHEKDGIIYHTTEESLEVGMSVTGEIDWKRRFSFMQNHTGEHIVSGIIKKLFEADNIGFHMGSDAVTIDFACDFTEEDLLQIEKLANEVVYANVPVTVCWPEKPELETMAYRSKKEINGDVRIVSVPDCDVCACCGTHTAKTGEIGVIKLLSAQKYKGGSRISMLCGERALTDYDYKNKWVRDLSILLSAKQPLVVDALTQVLNENAALKQQLAAIQNRFFQYKAHLYAAKTGRICIVEEGLTQGELQKFCLTVLENAPECVFAAVFAADEKNRKMFKYAISSSKIDVRPLSKDLNASFNGRGGGKKNLVQGTITGELSDIKSVLSDIELPESI